MKAPPLQFHLQVDEVGLEQVPDVIQNYHICVVKNRRIDLDVIAKATQMKIIMQYGVGLEGDYNFGTILINTYQNY